MTILPDAKLARGRISELYARNVTHLGQHDVVVANVGGAGQSLIGNILFELGLNYVDAYTEVLHADGRAVGAEQHAGYRRHLASLHDKDEFGDGGLRSLWPRFVKSHHPPVVFDGATFGTVWIIVRDPRDTLYAAYKWRSSFAEEEWDRVPDTFEGYLAGPGDFSANPVDDWSAFHTAWTQRARECAHADVLRFEDMKRQPVEVISGALERLGIDIAQEDVKRAVEASSFANMRAHEDRVHGQQDGAVGPRMVREGKPDGWKEWMTPQVAEFFSGDELRTVARQYGYDV